MGKRRLMPAMRFQESEGSKIKALWLNLWTMVAIVGVWFLIIFVLILSTVTVEHYALTGWIASLSVLNFIAICVLGAIILKDKIPEKEVIE